jgi:hypothetical protein
MEITILDNSKPEHEAPPVSAFQPSIKIPRDDPED